MPIKTSKIGVGMRASTAWEITEPLTTEEAQPLFDFAFAMYLQREAAPLRDRPWSDLETSSKHLLRSNKFPIEAGYHKKDKDGTWSRHADSDGQYLDDLAYSQKKQILYMQTGFDEWIELWPLATEMYPENYHIQDAARVVSLSHQIELARREGLSWITDALIYELGREIGINGFRETHERTWLAGERTREGGRRAAEATHGSEAERRARREAIASKVVELIEAGMTRTAAKQKAARLLHISYSTVRRAVER